MVLLVSYLFANNTVASFTYTHTNFFLNTKLWDRRSFGEENTWPHEHYEVCYLLVKSVIASFTHTDVFLNTKLGESRGFGGALRTEHLATRSTMVLQKSQLMKHSIEGKKKKKHFTGCTMFPFFCIYIKFRWSSIANYLYLPSISL